MHSSRPSSTPSGRPLPPTCPNAVDRASIGLSPAPDLRARLLRGHLVSPGHRVQLGRGGTPRQRERDDAAASTRRVGGCSAPYGHLVEEAICAFDKVIGLDLSDVSLDGSLHKAPCGGEGTGPNPTDRGKTGWKWSVATDTNGVPIGWVIDGANRNDSILLAPTLDDIAERGLLCDIETIWLDRGYDSDITRTRLARTAASTTPSSPRSARGDPPEARRTSPWACAGPSSAPTRG